jgi:hypothetical protein
VAALVLAGCGADTDEPSGASKPSNPKPSLETRVNVGALGFALDDFRSAAEIYLQSIDSCFDLARLGADSASGHLCLRSAVRPLERERDVVLASFKPFADAGGRCQAQLRRVGNRLVAAYRSTFATATGMAQTDDGNRVSALLDGFDRKFNRVDSAFARAQDVCGG